MSITSITIDTAPAYELLFSLGVAADVDHHDVYDDPPLLSGELQHEVHSLCGESDLPWAHLIALVRDCPPPRDVPQALDFLQDTDGEEIRLCMLGYYTRCFRRQTPPEVIAAAARGDASARRELLRTSSPDDPSWQSALRTLLPHDAAETKSRVLAILQRWYEEWFGERETQLMAIIRRDAGTRQGLPDSELLSSTLPGIEYVPEPGIRRVLLIPSYSIRPEIHSLDSGETQIFGYPVADESISAETGAASPRLLRLMKALGDERRLRILKRLTTGDYTLAELAAYLDAGNTTVLHHLIILRGAGLVRVRAPSKRYTLRRESVAQVGDLLERFLH